MGRTLRTLTALAGVVLTGAIGCTVQDTTAPALTGPSGLSVSLSLQADKPILERGGFTTVRVRAVNHQNQPMAMALRAELRAQGLLFDYGRLSTRDLVTGSDGTATVTYFAPAPLVQPRDSGEDVVTIVVTPMVTGDSRGLVSRELDIRLVPQGVIIPNFPLVPQFTISNTSPQAFTPVVFNATTSTRNGAQCLDNCGYMWTFGDGSSASGRIVEKTYTAQGQYLVYLRINDEYGHQDSAPQTVTVGASTAITGQLTVSPTPVRLNIASQISALGISGPSPIVEYRFSFGDASPDQVGTSATATHAYSAVGTYTVRVTVRDAVGRTATFTLSVSVTA
ncbi:MAG: PKD domain-containing protein [Vicinamibacterales bacterium]|nr:PKD domain-containing protein [Vicinamibacterales bacterium]